MLRERPPRSLCSRLPLTRGRLAYSPPREGASGGRRQGVVHTPSSTRHGQNMRTVNALLAAGQTDPGRQRTVNEDRFHCDPARGLFVVIDGVGGQAAGGKAADIALSTLRTRLERETGTASERVREAITIANN